MRIIMVARAYLVGLYQKGNNEELQYKDYERSLRKVAVKEFFKALGLPCKNLDNEKYKDIKDKFIEKVKTYYYCCQEASQIYLKNEDEVSSNTRTVLEEISFKSLREGNVQERNYRQWEIEKEILRNIARDKKQEDNAANSSGFWRAPRNVIKR